MKAMRISANWPLSTGSLLLSSHSTTNHVLRRRNLHYPSWTQPPDTLPDENDITGFRRRYFKPEKPVVLRSAEFARNLPAYQKWFIEQQQDGESGGGGVSQLNYEYLSQFGHAIVPLEMTATFSTGGGGGGGGREAETENRQIQFQRLNSPLSMFLAYTQFTGSSSRRHNTRPPPPASPHNKKETTIYLAQAHVSDLPPQLSADFSPTPKIVTQTGKNDIYATNLWIGPPPTFTPLHKDPNPNLFVQLAGRKRVRLLRPEDGWSVYMAVRNRIARESQAGASAGAAIRGEEMMMGSERQMLEDVIWGDNDNSATANVTDGSDKSIVGHDVLLERGDALFIPKGWWHSLKGVGEGITASVNWWFR